MFNSDLGSDKLARVRDARQYTYGVYKAIVPPNTFCVYCTPSLVVASNLRNTGKKRGKTDKVPGLFAISV